MQDKLGPTGNTADICQWCKRAHHADMACYGHELKETIFQLQKDKKQLIEAGIILQRYSLPPRDASGEEQWQRAISIIREIANANN